MKIQNHAPYQLSNYEVLNHCLAVHEDLSEQAALRQQEKGRSDAQLLLQYPVEREFRKPDESDPPLPEDFPEQTDELRELEEQAKRRGDMDNARWVAEKVIKYLGNWYMPTYRQDGDGIFAMVQELQNHDLSKGEILQVVNTVPSQDVEVYTCIQNLEDRYETDEEQAQFYSEVLQIVSAHTLSQPDETLPPMTNQGYIPSKGSGIGNGGENGDMEMDQYEAAMNGTAGEEEAFAQAEYYDQEDDGMMGGDDYVHEAEWGADREGGVDDDVPDND